MTITQEAVRQFSDARRWRDLYEDSDFKIDTRPGLFSMYERPEDPVVEVLSSKEAQTTVSRIIDNLNEYKTSLINTNLDTSVVENLTPTITRLLTTLRNSRERIPIADYIQMEEALSSVEPIISENLNGITDTEELTAVINTITSLVESNGPDSSLPEISSLLSSILGNSSLFKNERINSALNTLQRFTSSGDLGSKLSSLVPELILGEISDLDLQDLSGFTLPDIPSLDSLSELVGGIPQVIKNIAQTAVQAYGEGLVTTEAVPLQPVSTFNYGESEIPIREAQLSGIPTHRFTQRISSTLDSGLNTSIPLVSTLGILNSMPEGLMDTRVLNEVNGVIDIMGFMPEVEVPVERVRREEDYRVEEYRLD